MSIVIVTAPAGYPVTLAEAKSHLRITDTSHDERIQSYIAAATAMVESATEMLLVEQTIRLEVDGFPEGEIEIPVYPIQSVTSVKYDDADNVETTLVANTDYFVSLGGRYPKITPVSEWPTAYEGKPASVRIVMVAGYDEGSASPTTFGDNVPADLIHAIKVKIKELFDIGGETIIGANTVSPSVNTVEALTLPYRRWWIA